MKSASLLSLIVPMCMSVSACDNANINAVEPIPSTGKVNIYRGEWGVPHIYASRQEDGFYGLGYSLAEDQIQRFMLYVLMARGELAANVSTEDVLPHLRSVVSNQKQMIESDYQMKLWRLNEFAEGAVEKLDPQLKRNYQSYVEGVKAFMRANPDKVPAWAPNDVNIVDMITYPHALLWGFYQAGSGIRECQSTGVVMNTAEGTKLKEPVNYSNEWAIMPRRTSTGGAILLSDPHGGMDGRFSYEYRLHAGDFHSAGYTLGPLMIVGRNANVGWAVTTGSPDTSDCFIVDTLPEDNLAYMFDGEKKKVETRKIEIKVKGKDSVWVLTKYTDHNGVVSPVVAEAENKLYVVSTAYLNELESFHNSAYRMNISKNVDEFKDSQQGMFPQNFMAADTNGDIIYVRSGLTPVRPDSSVDWSKPVDGNSSKYTWTGVHSVDDLLVIKSPESGYLTNNNVDPAFMDKTLPKEMEGMPDYLLYEGLIPNGRTNSRTYRALEILSAATDMSEEDAFAFAFDTQAVKTDRWLTLLKDALEGHTPNSEDHKSFLDDLLSFDGKLDSKSTAALKYILWREAIRDYLTTDNLDNLVAAFQEKAELSDEFEQSLIKATEDAMTKLLTSMGGLARTYGDEHRITGNENQSWGMSGGYLGARPISPDDVIECSKDPLLCPVSMLAIIYGPPNDKGHRIAVAGSRLMRLDFYSPEGIKSFSANNPGISDDISSPHSDDQAENLLSKQMMKPIYFNWEDLKSNIATKTTLDVNKK